MGVLFLIYDASLAQWASGMLILLILTFVGSCVYNLWFHPLSAFPGPKWAAVSSLWTIRRWLSGNYVHEIEKLHNQYGVVVRTAPNQLSFNSGSSWKDIYGHNPGRKPFLKGSFYEPLPGEVHNIVSVSDTRHHASMRKTLSHGFSSSSLANQEDLVQGFVDLLIDRIEKNCCDKPGDMVKWYNYTTFDTIGELAFGEPFECLKSGKSHFWIDILFDSIKSTNLARAFEYLPPVRLLFRKLYEMRLLPQFVTAPRIKQWQYAREKISRRLEKEPGRPDFLARMIAERKQNNASFQELQSQANLLVIAGSETTATALSGITYYLCRNPDAFDKVAQEVRPSFEDYDLITGRSTEPLTYLKAVIEEGLRIYPPIPTGPPRVSPGETVSSYFVPKGTIVAVSSWSATHSERNFHRPYEFSPERWIDGNSKDDRSASQPFLLGSRGCLGRNLAQLELRLILAKIIWKFDFKLTDDKLDWVRDNKAYGFWDKPELLVQFSRRLDS